jgi:hypothetical protein
MTKNIELLIYTCVNWYRINYPRQQHLLHLNTFEAPTQRPKDEHELMRIGMKKGIPQLEYIRKGKTYFIHFGKETKIQTVFKNQIRVEGMEYKNILTYQEFTSFIKALNGVKPANEW